MALTIRKPCSEGRGSEVGRVARHAAHGLLKIRLFMTQAERAEQDKLAVAIKDLEAGHTSKSELCKELEERRMAKAELAQQLAAEVDGLKQERSGLSTQLSALQEAHER